MESMDSSSKRVSLSATQGTPLVLPTQPFEPRKLALSSSLLSPISLPIRAPITVDDDSDFESNNDKFEDTSYGSSVSGNDSGNEYEVFVGGGEEFETASESVRGLVANPDQNSVGKSDIYGKGDIFRPVVAYPDGEKLIRPIAQLSWEDDDDGSDVVFSEVEDEFSLGSIDVNNLGVGEKISVAPRIKIFEVEEGKGDESMVHTKSLIVNLKENFDSDIFVEADNSFSIDKEEKLNGVEGFVQDVLVKDTSGEGAALHEEPLEPNKRDVLELNSELISHVKHFCAEEHKFNEFDTARNTQIEDSGDSESFKEENDAIQGCCDDTDRLMENHLVEKEEAELLVLDGDNGGAENNLKYAVEELLVCENGNQNSGEGARLYDGTIEEIPESKMDEEIDFDKAKENSLAAMLESTDNCCEANQKEFDFDELFVTDEAEEIVDSGECPLSEIVDDYKIEDCNEDMDEVEKHGHVFDDDAKDLANGSSERAEKIIVEVEERVADCREDMDEVKVHSHVSDDDAEDLAHGSSERTEKIIVEVEERVVDCNEDMDEVKLHNHVSDDDAEDSAHGSSERAEKIIVEVEERVADCNEDMDKVKLHSHVSNDDAEDLAHGSSERTEKIIVEVEERVVDCNEDTDEVKVHSHVFDDDAEDLAHGSPERTEKVIVEEERVAAASHLGTVCSQESIEGNKSASSMDILNTTTVLSPTTFDSSLHSGEAASQQTHIDTLTSLHLSGDEVEVSLSIEDKKKIEKMQVLRVKFLRLVHRLGISLEDSKVSQVLEKLFLDVEKHTNHFDALESTKKVALDFEADNQSNLDFCLNILVLGKSGVGKSATINFIFGEKKAMINAFKPATTSLKEIVGTVDGIKIRILDTPGLKVPAVDQAANQKMLSTINKYIKKFPPDVVFYVDRLDTQNRDDDLPLLRSITRSLGSSIWKNAVVTLTHAASVPPDGSTGLPLNRDIFVAQKYHGVLQSISMAVDNLYLMNSSIMHPLALVENNSLQSDSSNSRSQLLLLCHSLKVLSEASSIAKREKPSDRRKFMGFPIHSSLMHYLLSSLLQSHAHPNNAESDTEFADLWDLESEEEDEYDQLPSFRPLSKSQIAMLSKEQRKNYFEEYDYRVKLLQRKQWKEEIKRLREIKTKGKEDGAHIYHDFKEDEEKEDSNSTSESVPLPDITLPLSFDGEESAYRYRSLDLSSELLVRPVMETYCWDHDCGYNGVNLEKEFVVSDRFPTAFSFQITKDKEKLNLHLDSSLSMKHGENCSTLAGLDIHTLGDQLAYIVRGETKVRSFRINKTTAGVTVNFIGKNLATGLKVEDQIAIGKFLVLATSAGALRSQGNTAYGANLELRLKEKDFPIGQDQSNLGLSLMKSKGDLALTAFLQSQFSIGQSSKTAIHIGLNHRRNGKITIKTSSSDQLQIALAGILPIMLSIFKSIYSTHGTQNL
ncbi:translocase of chloroplast 101, chloroplastic [Cannabis sativa]|uniref:translocase of chloroplast 101, chloroplastic n=1 Tax=Cannabis sativa TaxID=3483 RepID=UPI0029C9BD5A|nr:translocase of chloroplast 101, chloroplastic [Cannabis sativa]